MNFKQKMMHILRHLKVLDWLIFLAGIWLLWKIDYQNVLLEDVIYLAAFGMWFIMLVIRLYFEEKRRKNKE